MSKLFRNIIETVFCGNPYLYEELLQAKLDAEYHEYHYVLDQWKSGKKGPHNATIAEWEYLGKPSVQLKSI